MARKRKNGRWEGRVVIGYDDKGLPKTKNVLAKTKAECVEKLKRLQEECGSISPVKVRPDMPLGDWLGFWYQTHSKSRIRPTTQSKYENMIRNHMIPALGEIPLNKLDQATLQNFFNDMKRAGRKVHADTKGTEMSEASVQSCHAVCRMALERAVKDGLIKRNPITGCKLPKQKAVEMKILTKEEIQRFLIQAKEEGTYELFLLELTTGLRRGELLALTWEDLDFETGKLHVSKQVCPAGGKLITGEPKTRAANRTIVLPPAMVAVLKEYKATVFSDLMFPSRTKPDRAIDPCHVRKRLQAILERAGCKKVRFHDLRHTFSSLSLEHGMDVKTLSTIIGHVSSSTTLNIYTHVTSDMQQRAAASIDRGIAKAETPPLEAGEATDTTEFTPYNTPRRRPGTGCISQINDHLWEGRYSPVWPDGKRRPRNVYAHTREECEEKLKDLILEMRAEIAEARKAE